MSSEIRTGFDCLTPREVEIANLIAADRSTEEISEALGISVHTTRTHVKNALRRAGVRSRAGLAALAAVEGLTR